MAYRQVVRPDVEVHRIGQLAAEGGHLGESLQRPPGTDRSQSLRGGQGAAGGEPGRFQISAVYGAERGGGERLGVER